MHVVINLDLQKCKRALNNNSTATAGKFLSPTLQLRRLSSKEMKRLHGMRRLQNASAATLHSRQFIHHDAIRFFLANWTSFFEIWVTLLEETRIRDEGYLSPQSIMPAVNALERTITTDNPSNHISRIGYMQLSCFLDSLVERIKSDRIDGLLTTQRGRGDMSTAIDLYVDAQKPATNKFVSRRKLQECRRIGRRWRELAKPSFLLLVIFTNDADLFVYVDLLTVLSSRLNGVIVKARKLSTQTSRHSLPVLWNMYREDFLLCATNFQMSRGPLGWVIGLTRW